MNRETALALNKINTRFYRTVHESFSATRNSAWQGWDRLADLLKADGFGSAHACAACLDVACGNMRFERYLADRFPDVHFAFHGLDNCPELAEQEYVARFDEVDIVGELIEGRSLLAEDANVAPAEGYDLVVSFGFLHHVPGREFRKQAVGHMASFVKPGGYFAVSLWRFMANRKLAQKALDMQNAISAEGGKLASLQDQFEEGDYLLGWQDNKEAIRYCHHFVEPEVDELIEMLAGDFELADRFHADGRDGQLNAYFILKRKEISQINP